MFWSSSKPVPTWEKEKGGGKGLTSSRVPKAIESGMALARW